MGLSEKDRALAALIDWYRDMGVDETVSGAACDWLQSEQRAPGGEVLKRLAELGGKAGDKRGNAAFSPEPRRDNSFTSHERDAPRSTQQGSQVSARGFQSQPPDAAWATADDMVRGVATLSELREKLLAFDGCGLKATAKNTCFYRGSDQARVMIIGEAPGRDEDMEGRPFVGRAGQLLDRMLKAIDLGEADVHITNIVYWRPPGNRTPTAQEARVCRPFLEQQARLVAPDIVVLLGGAAAKNLLDTTQGIMRLRGKWRTLELGGAPRRVLATLHPAYLLRTPAAKRLAWRDLLEIKSALTG